MSGENSIEDMLEENHAGYQAVRVQLEALHMGRTALLRQGKVAAIYNDTGDAYQIGCDKYGLGHFTIQVIGERPISSGHSYSRHVLLTPGAKRRRAPGACGTVRLR